ncbi:hypothetical protein K493DRAFT_344746 [Basidiobolus meristosporus CBS 931.73]|uniref:BZIP domain-containing protein n=1 Tax=Basidiobolus meristosporus CBS 931.73 TaxID=1314790 RepID=A0A1Y1Z6V1_9FUNG|nr:hypothetical protein K493DRAFT_344746 [Basidiobolus meristosporus CBS 931.73]|eukprot:ORY05983.1 hypothetical protein K493DRAFT_344746 [Basidiobolus meristosporus CBS 931.73]
MNGAEPEFDFSRSGFTEGKLRLSPQIAQHSGVDLESVKGLRLRLTRSLPGFFLTVFFPPLGGKRTISTSTANPSSKDAVVDIAPVDTTTLPLSYHEILSRASQFSIASQSVDIRKSSTGSRPFSHPLQQLMYPNWLEPACKALKMGIKRGQSSNSDDNRQSRLDSHKRKESSFQGNDEKRRRFLERNRVAASKCRQKKKIWVKELEQRSQMVANRNRELRQLVGQLKEELLQLKVHPVPA